MRFVYIRTGPEIELESISPGDIFILKSVPYVATDYILDGARTCKIIECCNLENGHIKLIDGDVKVSKIHRAIYMNYEE